MPNRSEPEITEITRAHLNIAMNGKTYRIEGEGYSGDNRVVDYVLFANSVTDVTGAPVGRDSATVVLAAARELLLNKGWQIDVE